ncbi:hypothetical protein SPRG_14643 [Saprolegnia parasitica CBS 223.65]|uniref:Sfi1 spindle body domain-containing protein n=1 Tax=Saprolegnia parasitica (strain CBS 223.65) TaxID=695850 RepID=A0A067BNP1_SAPPC|nr:hypothetical protein SPRG_14643 [Saprolegnia parasitica CBS 223.65]KDO20104.1 hypothetical protein SPRG_14643 [Saprolegnia parasitica CBS 223.65]|eukprot:XP_012209207.1 hypothetical protein SPRG_14643 [Saprolegnia parasitica CBS 223.65]
MTVTRRRQHVWFRDWQRIVTAHRLARLHQIRRLGHLLAVWRDHTRYVLACRVQLAVAYDRLSLVAHWSHWRATVARTRRIHRLVQARWDRTCARVLHGWYQVLTSSMLGQYHAQRRWRTKLVTILRRWQRRASITQLIARSQRRRRRVLFGHWISHTCVQQAVRVMQVQRQNRQLAILLLTWQRTALLAQCRRRAIRKMVYGVWGRWRQFVDQRRERAQWHRQLWVVLERDYGGRPPTQTGSQAYRQSAQLLHEARTRRHLMQVIVAAWRRLLPVPRLVTVPRHRRQNVP